MTDQLTMQRLEYLAIGNEIRMRRAADKKLIKVGRLDPASVVIDPPQHWQSAKVLDLLLSMHRVGRVKAQTWLNIHGISTTKLIGELTQRQRVLLHQHLNVASVRRDRVRRMLDHRP